jgi:flagellar capping protein FliD
MGSDLRLTGLASGMDWQPIVEKLLELEALPKKRLESEKDENLAKVSDLGVLKSQLDTLKGAASSLQNKDLFDARKVTLSDNESGLTASASTGALTGDFKIEVVSLATQTKISSSFRSNHKLSSGLNLATSLKDLPLSMQITTGTFTISGKTFNISSLDIPLQDILDEVNAVNGGVTGVNPEGDDSGITLSYNQAEDKMLLDATDNGTGQANLIVLGSSTDTSNFLEALKLVTEPQSGITKSTSALGVIDMQVSLASANFSGLFSGLNSGLGNFFIGEGEGAVRIDYDVNNDSLSDLINRVNNSSGNISMFYDPVEDRFVVRNNKTGSKAITLHESQDWDSMSEANSGNGNILELMGLAAPKNNIPEFNPSDLGSYQKGDYVQVSSDDTSWLCLADNPSSAPNPNSDEWAQVIGGVCRSFAQEVGTNSVIRMNDGSLIYSLDNEFSEGEHGFDGIAFNVENLAIGDIVSFKVEKDASKAKEAIDKFVEEFNDAQEYISSLTKVNQDGDNVESSRFTGNQEINRLSSQLRRIVFGGSNPHSESATTIDNANLTTSTNNSSNDQINGIATQLGLNASDDGYVIKVLKQEPSNQEAYFEWDGSSWNQTSPNFSTFRISNIGMDFGISSNKIEITDSSLLADVLSESPEKVWALFSEEPVEEAYDTISQTNRSYQGITYSLDDFIENFINGDSSTGYKGTYNSFIERLERQNERIDEKMARLDSYLESREKVLSEGFMRMEEMQSKMDTQMQTIQNAFSNKK